MDRLETIPAFLQGKAQEFAIEGSPSARYHQHGRPLHPVRIIGGQRIRREPVELLVQVPADIFQHQGNINLSGKRVGACGGLAPPPPLPFSANLKQVTTKLVNNGVLAESRSGRSIVVRPGIAFRDAERVFAERSVPWSGAIQRVAELLRGASTRQAEVLATVHYASQAIEQAQRLDRDAVLAYASQWKQRRVPPLSANELDWALDALTTGGWIQPVPSPRKHQL